ncbi:MAG: hypothetical protein L6428_11905 [Candidatus Aminicenantes bacterium]|nr:hypothetical protein [Candidatus Aminicenantes bacterium]
MIYSKSPRNVREAISKLHSMLQKKRFLRGTTILRHITCGKPTCKCAKEEKHPALYIRKSKDGKLLTVFVPKSKWDEIKGMVENYRAAIALLETISEYEWKHIKDK